MPQMNLYFEKREDDKVKKFSEQWQKSKCEAVKKMVRDFTE